MNNIIRLNHIYEHRSHHAYHHRLRSLFCVLLLVALILRLLATLLVLTTAPSSSVPSRRWSRIRLLRNTITQYVRECNDNVSRYTERSNNKLSASQLTLRLGGAGR